MADEGRTVIFISHKLHEVKAVSDRVTVLRGGRTVATLATADASPQELAALMVGRDVELAKRVERARPPREDAALYVDGLSVRGDRGEEALRDVALSVREGEILGVAGVAGNGQRELAEAITGMRPSSGGVVYVGRAQAPQRRPARGDRGRGRPRSRGSSRHRRRAQPEHRREHGDQVLPRARRLASARS